MTTLEIVVCAGLLIGAALWAYATPLRRGPQRLSYPVRGSRKGASGAGRQLGDAISTLAHGSPSVQTWKEACEASMRASRRRRGLEEED